MNHAPRFLLRLFRRLSVMVAIVMAFSVSIAAEPLNDFALNSATSGKVFRLSEQKGKFVVLHFLLKTECPVCLRHTREYQTKSRELPNTAQIFIKPDADAEIRQWAEKLPKELLNDHPIYRDPEARLAKALSIPGGYKFHGQTVHYPALILINPKGQEVFRHVGKSNTDRFPFAELKEKIEELTQP